MTVCINRETFAMYGNTMYHAQCVEKSLAILVSSVFNKSFFRNNPDKRAEIQDEALSKTIGRLLIEMRKLIKIPPNLDASLNEGLKKRNWLAHDYFWERAGKLLTIEGKKQMISELQEITDFYSKLDAHLSSICEKWMTKAGITEQVLNAGIKKLIEDSVI